jgi:hypothetical protein
VAAKWFNSILNRQTLIDLRKKMDFHATHITLEDDGYCTVLSLADDALTPENYVILQSTNLPDKEDIQLNQDGVFLEIGGADISGYNLIESINVEIDSIVINLKQDEFELKRINISFENDKLHLLQNSLVSERFLKRI